MFCRDRNRISRDDISEADQARDWPEPLWIMVDCQRASISQNEIGQDLPFVAGAGVLVTSTVWRFRWARGCMANSAGAAAAVAGMMKRKGASAAKSDECRAAKGQDKSRSLLGLLQTSLLSLGALPHRMR